MTKTLNQIIFFSSTKIRIFFSATLGIRIFFLEKNHGTDLHSIFCLYPFYPLFQSIANFHSRKQWMVVAVQSMVLSSGSRSRDLEPYYKFLDQVLRNIQNKIKYIYEILPF